MPPKKKGDKQEKKKGNKLGKIVFRDNLPFEFQEIIKELDKKINLNAFRW